MNSSSLRSQGELTFELMSDIDLASFYRYVSTILDDHNLSVHHNITEQANRQRVEVWANKSNVANRSLVWLEVVPQGKNYDQYISSEILRTMNDENITSLYFFSNVFLNDEDKNLLSGPYNYIYSVEDIIKSIESIHKKREETQQPKRKAVSTPSGAAIIKSFAKKNPPRPVSVKIRTSSVPDVVHLYLDYAYEILDKIDNIRDIEEVPSSIRDWGKKKQYELLPELIKISGVSFTEKFFWVKSDLFLLVQLLITYIGNMIEYEAESSLLQTRAQIRDIIERLQLIDDDILKYKSDLMLIAERCAYRLSLNSITIAVVSCVLLISMSIIN